MLCSNFHLCIKLVKFREGSINQSKQPEAQCNEPTGCQAAAVMMMMMMMVMVMAKTRMRMVTTDGDEDDDDK